MKKVLIITYYWPPSGGAGVQRWLKFAKYLPEYDWKPIILTIDPNRATYPVRDESLLKDVSPSLEVHTSNAFEFFSLYSKVNKKKQIPYGGFANEAEAEIKEKISRFIRGNFFIPDPRRGWNKFAYKKALKLIKEQGIDTVVTTSPPHSSQLIGLKLKKKLNINWISDLRDSWTDIYYYKMFYPTFFAKKLDLYYEAKVVENADVIITAAFTQKKLLEKKYNLSEDKVSVLTNGFDDTDFNGLRGNRTDRFTITYVGTLAETYPVSNFIKALVALQKKGIDFCMQFIGPVDAKHSKELSALKKNSVEYLTYQPHEKAVEYMNSSSLLLLVTPEHRDSKSILPGKMFEYMATGNPILGIGPIDGDMAKIVSDCDAGLVSEPSDECGILHNLNVFLNDYSSTDVNELNSKVNAYSRRNITKSLSEILNALDVQKEET